MELHSHKPKEEVKAPPVKEGDTLARMRCVGIGSKGDGVFKADGGFVIMAPGALLDQEYTLKVTKVLPKYAFATIDE